MIDDKRLEIYKLNTEKEELELSNSHYEERIDANNSRLNKIQSELSEIE